MGLRCIHNRVPVQLGNLDREGQRLYASVSSLAKMKIIVVSTMWVMVGLKEMTTKAHSTQ